MLLTKQFVPDNYFASTIYKLYLMKFSHHTLVIYCVFLMFLADAATTTLLHFKGYNSFYRVSVYVRALIEFYWIFEGDAV